MSTFFENWHYFANWNYFQGGWGRLVTGYCRFFKIFRSIILLKRFRAVYYHRDFFTFCQKIPKIKFLKFFSKLAKALCGSYLNLILDFSHKWSFLCKTSMFQCISVVSKHSLRSNNRDNINQAHRGVRRTTSRNRGRNT